MNILHAMMQMARYFNEGDGRNADQQTKDSFNAIRDFVTTIIDEAMREDKSNTREKHGPK